MITFCQPRLNVRIYSRAQQNLQSLRHCTIWRGLSFSISDMSLTAEKMAAKMHCRSSSSSSSSSYLTSSLSAGLRYFGSRGIGSDPNMIGKTVTPKGKSGVGYDTKQSEEEKTGKIIHKPYLITSGNSTRLKNDKIRQLQQQGEDDRQQNEAMMATSVSYFGHAHLMTHPLMSTSLSIC